MGLIELPVTSAGLGRQDTVAASRRWRWRQAGLIIDVYFAEANIDTSKR